MLFQWRHTTWVMPVPTTIYIPSFMNWWSLSIHQRSQTSYTTLCNDVVNHGGQFWGLQVFADHTRKNICKTNAFTIFACRALFCAFAFMLRLLHAGNIPRLNHKFSPVPGSRWRRVWNLLCISVIWGLLFCRRATSIYTCMHASIQTAWQWKSFQHSWQPTIK